MPLNDMLCRNAKPKERLYKLKDAKGLFLQITPGGGRYWYYRYRQHDRDRVIALGEYPDMSLQEARKERARMKAEVDNGTDVILVRKEERQLAKYRANQTFEQVAREWHQHYSDQWTPRHAAYIIRRLELHAFPELGKYPIHTLTSHSVLACLQKAEKSAPEIARRVLNMCSRIFHYAGATGRLDKDLTFGLKGVLKSYKPRHYASISIDELPALLEAMHRNDARLYRQTHLAMRLLMLTAVRTIELIQAKWTEFDFEKALWTIPAERMKMRKTHIVPLSRQALEILNHLKQVNGKREYVFPSIPYPRKPMSSCTILGALKRIGYHRKMTGHGFRALFMGVAKEQLDYRHEVADRQLAHEPKNSVDRAYDRASFLPQRIKLMQEYADYLDNVLHQQQRKNYDRQQPEPATPPITAGYRIHQAGGCFAVYPRQCFDIPGRGEVGEIPTTH